MKIEEVSHDVGIGESIQVIGYAVDEQGNYVKAPSGGWEPVNVANGMAWKEIRRNVEEVEVKVQAGRLSPLAYYMAMRLMDPGMLAQYVDMAGWRVRLHLKPFFFKRLNCKILARYAAVFQISVDELHEKRLRAPCYPKILTD